MRILFDHQAFSLQSHGGITRVFSEIIRHLNLQANISTTVLLGYSSTQADFREIVTGAGRVVHAGWPRLRPGFGTYAVNEAVTALYAPFLGKFEIYHNTLYRFSPVIRAARRVATLHDCVQERFPQLFPHHARVARSKRRMFREADLILCVSEASRRDMLHFYDVPPEKAIVVHNGVSPMRRIPGQDAALRVRVPGNFLLYVGARYAYKNFQGLLRVYAASEAAAGYSLIVAGGGPPAAEEMALIRELNLESRVKFIPYASSGLLAEAYALSSLFIYPSFYEGFGMPPLEAASVGCPALVASNPASQEICRDSVFYFDPMDASDFSRMLAVALSDNEGRACRVQRAHELLKLYTWERCGSKTLDAYRSLE